MLKSANLLIWFILKSTKTTHQLGDSKIEQYMGNAYINRSSYLAVDFLPFNCNLKIIVLQKNANFSSINVMNEILNLYK